MQDCVCRVGSVPDDVRTSTLDRRVTCGYIGRGEVDINRHKHASLCSHAGKAKAKDTGKKAPAAEEVDDIIVEEPKDAGEGQTAAEREEAEQEEAGVHPATAILHL